MKKEQTPKQSILSKEPLTGSKKIYLQGKMHNIKVAMREISLSPTKLSTGKMEENFPVAVYDTSGPYTDPNVNIDLKKGLPRLREEWILKRGDVEQLKDFTSAYSHERLLNKSLDPLRFEHLKKPLKAK